MELGKVIGTLWATKKYPTLDGYKLLVVQDILSEGEEKRGYRVAIDTVDAGVGDIVLTVRGSSSKMTETTKKAATDCTIVGVVDTVDNV